ncbi:hypothetical protein PENSPDRAFT_751633 [Peniophora sp. CONT]|nr:hypothetical protein PENSPDRAFT_751633 [Peniophora sp. CONT]
MATVDPLQTLQAALAQPPNSVEQAQLLEALREALEARPAPLPILCATLMGTVNVNVEDSLLKRFVLDLIHFGIARANLSLEQRTQLASQSLDTLAGLLVDPTPRIVKVAVQAFASIYPLLFMALCQNRNARPQWETLNASKARILNFVWTTQPVAAGVRLAAVKFMQRVILVQTRGVADPRLQNKNDPNLSMCPVDHPYIPVAQLEAEGTRLLETVLTMLYTSSNADIVTSLINSWAPLVRLRPTHIQLVVTSLTSWRPNAFTGQSFTTIKSVEKSVRIFLVHISHLGSAVAPFNPEIRQAIAEIDGRIEKGAMEEKARRAALKRPASAAVEPPEKRQKLDNGAPAQVQPQASGALNFSSLPPQLVTELIVANLQAFSESELQDIVRTYKPAVAPAAVAAAATPQPTPPPVAAKPVAAVPPPSAPAAERKKATDAAAKARAKAAEITAAAPRPESTAPPSVEVTATPEVVAVAEDKGEDNDKDKTVVKEEPVDPLKMDIDDEVEEEPSAPDSAPQEEEVEDEEAAAAVPLDLKALLSLDLRAPPPRPLEDTEKAALVKGSVVRIEEAASEVVTGLGAGEGEKGVELWMMLVVRMVTRGAEPSRCWKGKEKESGEGEGGKEDVEGEKETALALAQRYEQQDQLRANLYEYIMADFAGRMRLATMWMNEEWYSDQLAAEKDSGPELRHNYDTWLSHIVSAYLQKLSGKDRTFGRFLLDLPSVPTDVFQLLRDLCITPQKMEVGFVTLRDFVNDRPTLRAEAMGILLELTTHAEKSTRAAAIITLKRWVGDIQPMDGMVRDFALQLLRRLQSRPAVEGEGEGEGEKKIEEEGEKMVVDGETNGMRERVMESGSVETAMNGEATSAVNGIADGADVDENMEDGQLPQEPQEEILRTPYLTDELELPAKKEVVLQHIELLLALSTKVPAFLEELFAAYGEMDISVQEAIQDLITQLMKTLGPTHTKLLSLLRNFPPGADTLVLRVLNIFIESGRPPPALVSTVKEMVSQRDLDARFIMPVVAELDKADIIKNLPRIVSMLNGTQERRAMVKNVFSAIVVSAPEKGFSSSNAPRMRQSELLTPAELMVFLHNENLVPLKPAIEAIGICFSMSEVFRSEVLAAVMQQIVDEPVLPTPFLRTVIQAVTTYKSLVGFVSTTLLSRLITKKIWMNPPLWEGFIRCAKVTQPHSFNALLQLPKEQIKEIIGGDKNAALKVGLKDFVMRRAGGNRARVAWLLEIFGEDEPAPGSAGTGAGQNGTQPPGSPAPASPTVPETPANTMIMSS